MLSLRIAVLWAYSRDRDPLLIGLENPYEDTFFLARKFSPDSDFETTRLILFSALIESTRL